MALTAKDVLTKTPVIKKPKTLNPLGAIVFALLIGGGHTLIYSSLLRLRYFRYFSVFGFLLVILSTFFIIASISLSAKSILFTLKIDKVKSSPAQIIFQILLFYLGFLPVYGFTIVYLEETIALWKILIITVIVVVLFAGSLFFNIRLLQKNEARINDLKKVFYQPKKLLLICFGLIITSIVTGVLFAF